jgi:hypothetical protein
MKVTSLFWDVTTGSLKMEGAGSSETFVPFYRTCTVARPDVNNIRDIKIIVNGLEGYIRFPAVIYGQVLAF